MRFRFLTFSACMVPAGGCQEVRGMLPHHGTTSKEARATIIRCGLQPTDFVWRVEGDGTFAYELARANGAPLGERQTNCLSNWTDLHLIKTAYIID